MSREFPVDIPSAEGRLMRYLAIEGIPGEEAAISAAIVGDLKSLGVAGEAIRFDSANERIPVPTQTGNLIVTLPGTRSGERVLFSTHMDTVPLCAGAKPRREGNRIVSDGTTALGGDNRTGCALLVTMVETLLKHDLPHPPITLLFTVREESGLQGSREIDPADLGGATKCFNVDGRSPSDLILGAVGQAAWEVEIHGKASHAGVAPERGISATLVASVGLAEAHRAGWLGKVEKPEGSGTSNPGIFGGRLGRPAGDATNVVTDYVYIRGEVRSNVEAFTQTIAEGIRAAFTRAQAEVTDESGEQATVLFTTSPTYPPFRLAEDMPVVTHAKRAAETLGLTPTCRCSSGGLDANWLVHHGLPTVTIGAGQHEIHTTKEYVELAEFAQGCRLAVALATLKE